MKTCMIWGDLSSDRAGEQYPTVPICDDCVSSEQSSGKESIIVSVGDFDPDFGDTYELCGKTLEEESEEK